MKKSIALILIVFLLFTGCTSTGFQEKAEDFFRLQVIPTVRMGAGQDAEEEAEAETATAFYEDLSSSQTAFICNTWNYGIVDGKPRYELNSYPDLPVELDSYGHCIWVDENYFLYNPVEVVGGSSISDNLIYADNTLNLLVPNAYQERENEIGSAYLERFWFEKVEVDNIYRERLGQELNSTTVEDLRVNIIYVQDGQTYFTFNREVAAKTDCLITDPIVMIYTGNIHPVQSFSMISGGVYFYSDSQSADELLAKIQSCAATYDVEDIVRDIQALAS